MDAYGLKNAMGIDRIPYDCVCGEVAEAAHMIELNYYFKDLDAAPIHQSVNLRVVLSSATGDTGAILPQAAATPGAAVASCAIGNTRGLMLDLATTDGEFESFMVRTVAPDVSGTFATVPTNASSALSLQITATAGYASTTYVKIYNQLGVLVNERAVVWS